MQDVSKFRIFLERVVKIESKTGNISTGRVTALHTDFAELAHRNGLKTLISYDQIAEIAEIPGR